MYCASLSISFDDSRGISIRFLQFIKDIVESDISEHLDSEQCDIS